MKAQKTIFTSILIALATSLNAQNYNFSVKGTFGTHVYQDQGHLFQDKIYGGEFGVYKYIGKNDDDWIKKSRATHVGVDFIYRNLSDLKGPNDTAAHSFGQIFGLTANVEFDLFRIGKMNVTFKPAVGIGYTNKYFYNSPRNRIIGTPLNEIIKADLGVQFPLSYETDLLAGFNFLHFSNGGQTVPNGGLNTANIYLGFKFGKKDSTTRSAKSRYQPLRRSFIELAAGFGQRGVYEKRHEHLYKNGFFAGYGYYLNDLITLKVGADAVYYYDLYDANNNIETFQYYASSFKRWRTGLSIGADLNLWRISVNAQLGKYVYFKRLYPEASWYWTFGPTFNITNRFGVQAKTYMHFAQADYINYGLVYRL